MKSSRKRLTSAISFPRLKRIEQDSIRALLQKYDAYALKIQKRVEQLLGDDNFTTESIVQTSLKFSVDRDELESFTDCGFIEGVESYETLTDQCLRHYLESKVNIERSALTESAVDDILSKELRIHPYLRSCRARFELLFASYTKVLRRHGLKDVKDENTKRAVQHTLDAIRLTNLQKRLRSDNCFAYS